MNLFYLNTSIKVWFEACFAGNSPKINPTMVDTPIANTTVPKVITARNGNKKEIKYAIVFPIWI